MNNGPIFDPFGRLARYLPEELLHRLIRSGMIVLLTCFLAVRIKEYPLFALKPLWLVETMLFAVLIVAFLLRSQPCDRSRGFRDIIIPLLASLLPFALLLTPPNATVISKPSLLSGIFWGMTAATALTVWSMWALRRCFSITVEARSLTVGGPYRYIRHPIYLGEMLAAAGVTVLRFSSRTLALFFLFAILQLLRSRWEESKLTRNFPDYTSFAARSRWFW